MAPHRSELATPPEAVALLGVAERHLRVGDAGQMATAVTRSHLADFRCVGWFGGVPDALAVAIDAEISTAPPPAPLVRRFGPYRFWERWTRAECLCKLAGVPMLAWWPKHGLDVPADFAGAWRTLHLEDLVVSVAVQPGSS